MNKLIHKLFLLIFAFSLSSQELDENFLDSLPNDIRKDVVERSSSKEKQSDPNYSSFQYSSKLKPETCFGCKF